MVEDTNSPAFPPGRGRAVPLLTRRTALRLGLGSVLGASPLLCGFPSSHAATQGFVRGRHVVLVELSGANDGLNSVIPYTDAAYYDARPTLAVQRDDVIRLDNRFGFHPKMTGAAEIWEAGSLAVLHGLGYPAPNKSHFASIALWNSGGDGTRAGRRGWITGPLSAEQNRVDAHGVSFGGDLGVFDNNQGIWLTMGSPDTLVVDGAQMQNSAAPQNTEGMPNSIANPALSLVLDRKAQLLNSLKTLETKLASNRWQPQRQGFNSDLGQQLSHVARLIAVDADIPAFHVTLGGFDTHRDQGYRHARLMDDLFTSIAAFRREMRSIGRWDDVVLVTYSEFGRRVIENGSRGTDHGTAAPHFIAGGSVRGGFYGVPPSLTDLDPEGDLKHSMDYRAMYQALLEQWLGIQTPTDFSSYTSHALEGLFQA